MMRNALRTDDPLKARGRRGIAAPVVLILGFAAAIAFAFGSPLRDIGYTVAALFILGLVLGGIGLAVAGVSFVYRKRHAIRHALQSRFGRFAASLFACVFLWRLGYMHRGDSLFYRVHDWNLWQAIGRWGSDHTGAWLFYSLAEAAIITAVILALVAVFQWIMAGRKRQD